MKEGFFEKSLQAELETAKTTRIYLNVKKYKMTNIENIEKIIKNTTITNREKIDLLKEEKEKAKEELGKIRIEENPCDIMTRITIKNIE